MLGVVVWDFKNAADMEMEKQVFGNMFAGPGGDYGHRGDWSPGPAELPHHLSPIFSAGTSGDSSVVGTGPWSKLFRQLSGR